MFITEKIIDCLPAILILTDQQGRILNANQAALRIFKKDPDEILGVMFQDLCNNKTKEKFESFIYRVTQNRDPVVGASTENMIDTNNSENEIFWQITSLKSKKLTEGDFIIIVGSNTEDFHRSLQSQLLESSRVAAVSTLAGGVAHELNNPLAIVKLYLQRISSSEGIGDDVKKLLGKVDQATKRMADIVENLRSFAKDSISESWMQIDLKVLLERVLYFLRPQIEKNSIAINLPDHDVGKIQGSYNQLSRVFECVLTNAIEAIKQIDSAEDNPKSIDVKISNGKYDSLIIEVADTGVGMSKETCERIFDPFYTTKEIGQGTGLGMSTVYNTILLHSGTVKVESELGKGTSVIIDLPLNQTSVTSG